MKNQDIFEVFSHLKTLFGGNPTFPAKNAQAQKGVNNENKGDALTPSEARLRDFHIRHEALSRKITLGQGESAPPATRLVFSGEKRERNTARGAQNESQASENAPSVKNPRIEQGARSAAFSGEKTGLESLPLFPPSLP